MECRSDMSAKNCSFLPDKRTISSLFMVTERVDPSEIVGMMNNVVKAETAANTRLLLSRNV